MVVAYQYEKKRNIIKLLSGFLPKIYIVSTNSFVLFVRFEPNCWNGALQIYYGQGMVNKISIV